MKRILQKLAYGILVALAYLPMRALYYLSDILCFMLRHVVRYRRKLILKNLVLSFPDKTDKERKQILNQFYLNFTDYIVETIKLLHISDEEIKRRMEFVDVDVCDRLIEQNKSIVIYFSHCFNWEWATSFSLWVKYPFMNMPRKKGDPNVIGGQIYRPLKDKWFDSLMLKLRSRFYTRSIAKARALRQFLEFRRDNILSITGFMSDQKPSHGDPAYVTTFLNHPTAMITGTETLARRLGMAAVYWDMEKLSRGHYRITCRLIADDVSATPPMSVTAEYARMLETTIDRNPAIWLWSHNRWKNPVKTQPAPQP